MRLFSLNFYKRCLWLLLITGMLCSVLVGIGACQAEIEATAKLSVFSERCVDGFITFDASKSNFDTIDWYANGELQEQCRDQALCILTFSTSGPHDIRIDTKIEGTDGLADLADAKKSASTTLTLTLEPSISRFVGTHELSSATFDFTTNNKSYSTTDSTSYTLVTAVETTTGTVSGTMKVTLPEPSCSDAKLELSYTFSPDPPLLSTLPYTENFDLVLTDNDTIAFTLINDEGKSACTTSADVTNETSTTFSLPFLSIWEVRENNLSATSTFKNKCGLIGTAVWQAQ